MNDNSKQINIIGTNNRCQMKKLINKTSDNEVKKRVQSEKWSFSDESYEYSKQLQMIIDISNNKLNHIDEVSKIAIQEINRKIN